jgi:hypothetical protein
MKKLLLTISALSLASTPIAFSTTAQAQSANDEIETFCKPVTEAGGFGSVGECARLVRTAPLRFCQFLKEIDIYPITLVTDTGEQVVKNQGQCISFIRQLQ